MAVFIPHVPTRYDSLARERIPAFNLMPAEVYGELRELTDRNKPVNAETLPGMMAELRENIEEMKLDDYLLMAGDIVLIAAAINYATEEFGTVSVLRWDHGRKAYNVLEVKL